MTDSDCRGRDALGPRGFGLIRKLTHFTDTVINTNDVIAFYESSVKEHKKEMQRSSEEYLAFCQERGKEPEELFAGKIVI